MAHIKQVDNTHVVLMMQVENEVGILGDARDHSPDADKAFLSPVPSDLLRYLKAHRDALDPELRSLWVSKGEKTSGTWEEVFGDSTRADEIFMAWNYARYVQAVVATGNHVGQRLAGWRRYRSWRLPSGGPQPRVIDIWKAAGTALDLYAPDLYKTDFYYWAERYHRADSPLFIPETNGGALGAANVFYAMGEHMALGFSPFAIDAAFAPDLPTSSSEGASSTIQSVTQGNAELCASYAAIAAITPLVLDGQTRGKVHGFTLTKEHPSVEFDIDSYTVHVSLDEILGRHTDRGFGLIVMTGPNDFVGSGVGFRVLISTRVPGKHVGIASIDEGKYEDNKWLPRRRLNGDENDQGNYWRFDPRAIHTEHVVLYHYE